MYKHMYSFQSRNLYSYLKKKDIGLLLESQIWCHLNLNQCALVLMHYAA